MDSKSASSATRCARLLIADDDPAIRSLAAFHLRGQGWDVAFAVDAHEALAACGEAGFDLLLLDLNMPGGGGEAVVRALGGSVPVAVALSASCADKGFALPAGFAGALPKPFTRESLVEGVREHLPHGLAGEPQRGGGGNGHGGVTDPALVHLLPKVLRAMELDVESAAASLARGELERVGARAHAMRGAAGCYGLGDLAREAARLERAATEACADDAAEVLERMRLLLADGAQG